MLTLHLTKTAAYGASDLLSLRVLLLGAALATCLSMRTRAKPTS